MKGLSDVDADPSPSTMAPRDPSATSPSIQPAPGAVTWATDGMGHADASGTAAVAPGCDPSVTVAATSTCIDGVTIGCVVPTMVGTTSAVGSPICLIVGSSIAIVTGCSMTSKVTP